MSRIHEHAMDLTTDAETVFALWVTPSAIRGFWQAARAVVIPRQGGVWAAAWGADEDDPDYASAAVLEVWEPPRRLALGQYQYFAKDGSEPPFVDDMRVEMTVEPRDGGGCRLTIRQSGFPDGPEGDAFYADCETGWAQTFEGIRRYLGEAG